ncbi:hypothetical protein [Absidia glauca]|uniref:Cyclin n=1 Tax=Absidia glauca TaxID=4829 RepID=A0A168PI80_ABSGL|nr:hypothetical protein [Absidia glauca]
MQLDIAGFPVQTLVQIVSDLLESIILTNDALMSLEDAPLTHFHSRAKPTIPIHAYLSRILKFAPFSNEALLSLLVYFDRIALKRQYAVNSWNAHRLLITSVVVASKFTSDVYFQNSRYAKVGGLPLLELNRLELEFLFLCEFKLHIPLEELQDYGNQLLLFHTKNRSAAPNVIAAMPSPPIETQQPSTAILNSSKKTLNLWASTNTFNKIDTIDIESSVKKAKQTTFDSKTIPPCVTDVALKKKRKSTYSHQLPSVQKRFCSSPPYSEDSRNSKTTSIDALLH